jgi:hypothetical protein
MFKPGSIIKESSPLKRQTCGFDIKMLNGDIVTIDFRICGGYVNAKKADTFATFRVFNETTTNNVFITLWEKSFSTTICLTQYGIYEFINSHLKLL